MPTDTAPPLTLAIEGMTCASCVLRVEKALKKRKLGLPEDLVVAISSGNTLASADDPRPEVMLLGKQLSAALSKLQ